jgi:uncharacterized protein involved in exopolysaccharide biosynthesis
MDRESEIDFVALFWLVWDHKFLVGAISLVTGLIAAYLALTATPIFRAQVVVTIVHDNSLGAGGGLMNQLGGLANIAGVNLNNNGDDTERQAVLESRELVAEFVKRYHLEPLMNANKTVTNPLWFATARFQKSVIDLHDDKVKGTTTITVDWTDPEVAARWANDFVALANDILREHAIENASRNVAYLNKQLAQTSVVELQRVMYSLIESETKTLMLANGRVEYAFRIVDPAAAPQVRSSPRRTLIVASGVFIGGLLGSLFVWIRQGLRGRRATVQPA